ncbi:sulfotransferase family protein [Psychromarinibacter sp. S121]|uniref:sulfotransferase family protein n=1 Tax=Psychromarinibacter sp. S121 TaxID=3415127 RepID=UPI003C799CDC
MPRHDRSPQDQMQSPKTPRVLYIAGYSRSGSTIMDMVLNGHPDVASTGELTFLHDDAADTTLTCSCGAIFRDCPVYGDWLADRPDGEGGVVRRVESRANLDQLIAGHIAEGDCTVYRDYALSLFNHLAAKHDAEVIVDSSKSAKDAAGRPIALARLGGLDVRVLHLTRDPRAVANSYLQSGSNWVLEGRRKPRPLDTLRPVMGWMLANKISQRIGQALGPDRYMHVRYEDFQRDPATVLGRIGTFADLETGELGRAVTNGKAFEAGHNVGGNRTRLAPQVVSLSPKPVPRLPMAHSAALRCVCGRTARKFGYV